MKDEILTNLADRSDRDLKAQNSVLSDLSARLEDIQMRPMAALEQIQVLESLHFAEIRRRFDQIPDPKRRTNKWIYKPTEATSAS